MNKLDRKDFAIAVKTGSDANKSKFAKEAVRGEAYYATDTENLYFAQSTAGAGDATLSKLEPSKLAYKNNYSLSFDGTNDHLDPSSTFTNLWSGSFSISLWLKTPSTFAAGVDNYLGNDFVSNTGNIEFRQRQVSSTTAKIEFYLGNAVTTVSPYASFGGHTSAVLSTDTWYHIVLTADRPASGTTTATLYVNSSVETSFTAIAGYLSALPNAGGTWSNNTLIGARNNVSSGSGTGELFLEGHLDEMAFFNSVLSASDVTSIYGGGTPSDISSLSPVNWWRMGEGDSGSTTITDQGISGNDAVLVNAPTLSTDVLGQVYNSSYSLSFDGTNDYLSVSTFNLLSNTAWSVVFWVKVDVFGRNLLGKGSSTSDYLYINSSGHLQLINTVLTNNTLSTGVWTNIVLTRSSTNNIICYINGSAEVSTSFSSAMSFDQIGVYYTGTLHFDGLMDEVAIFNSELSASDVTSIYNLGTPSDISSLSPVHWWRMGENNGGSGTTITDIGSGGNHAYLQNGPTFSTDVP